MKILNYKEWLIEMSGVDDLLEDNEFNQRQYLEYFKESIFKICLDVFLMQNSNIHVFGENMQNKLKDLEINFYYN